MLYRRILGVGLAVWAAGSVCGTAAAAELADVYGRLVPSGEMRITSGISAYAMHETGIHGHASYAGFFSTPQAYSVTNGFEIPLVPESDLSVDISNDLPSRYTRSINNNSNVVSASYQYHLDQGQALDMRSRWRRGAWEWETGAYVKHQETSWNYALGLGLEPKYFSHFESEYRDVYLGLHYLSHASAMAPAVGLARVDRPLLAEGQVGLEAKVAVRGGRLTRESDSYFNPLHDLHYAFRTDFHASPEFMWRCGITPTMEAGIGIGLEMPFHYKYFYEDYKTPPGTSATLPKFINGVYSYDHWIDVPLSLRMRPSPRMELQGRLDSRYVRQALDYWEKKENGTQIVYEPRNLAYYNWKPSLEVKYLLDAGGVPAGADNSSQKLLEKGQFLAGVKWQMDITSLEKNGTQNFTDPYNIYQYPVDLFVAGTEYAAFSSGNTSASPAQVDPQDYHEFKLATVQGWSDRLNTRLACGYRTQANAHQFSVGDLSNRAFIFRPFYYFDAGIDWQMTGRATFTLDAHYVPLYRTEMLSSVNPEQFKAETRYMALGAKVRLIF